MNRLSDIELITAHHKNCPTTVREKLYIPLEKQGAFLKYIVEKAMLSEVVVLATCDRFDIYYVAKYEHQQDQARQVIFDILKDKAGLSSLPSQLSTFSQDNSPFQRLVNDDLVRYLFKTIASLESRTLGETQITGQVRDSLRLSDEQGLIGQRLRPIFDAALRCGKKVRHDTKIGQGVISLANQALRISQDIFGSLTPLNIALVGGGEAGAILVNQFMAQAKHSVTVTGLGNYSEYRARELNCHFTSFDQLDQLIKQSKIIITDSGDGQFIFTGERLMNIMPARSQSSLLIFDMSIPYDCVDSLEGIDNVFLYRQAHLEALSEKSTIGREQEIEKAHQIIKDEVSQTLQTIFTRDAAPIISKLRSEIDDMRYEILYANPEINAEEATRLLTQKILDRPSRLLKLYAQNDSKLLESTTEILNDLFSPQTKN